MTKLTAVFVHGWSVTNVGTYGELPLRLKAEALAEGIDLEIEEIFLGKYISFHDEVKVADISRAFQVAVNEQLAQIINAGERFVCITHSTGGPVMRDWWYTYFAIQKKTCPMSHLVMLAPANFGSALAQLGKARVGRLKSWFSGVEPGQGVLDWLELGSDEAWQLNLDWIKNGNAHIDDTNTFPFVLTGEYIDRAFYDHLNTYTGELGSDGVVRVAAANLESQYVKLVQTSPQLINGELKAEGLTVADFVEGPETPLRVVTNKSHSDVKMGIMNSVKKEVIADQSSEMVQAILKCFLVKNRNEYAALYNQFASETEAVQEKERVELETSYFILHRAFIHDKCSQVIFKVVDTEGNAVKDYDLYLTAGPNNDPNHLPDGFFKDKQRNKLNNETLTYFFNYDVMNGMDAVVKDGHTYRSEIPGIDKLGLKIVPRPQSGFVHYLECHYTADKELFEKALRPNSTTLVEIVLQRLVHKNVFRLERLEGNEMPKTDFKKEVPGNELA